ncbi:hypothetical protein B7494_g2409 [Chlorociboria aeruginascens]|nr:hypothetical protein B7494_g2409 [Chlorociboria aeruginascens]
MIVMEGLMLAPPERGTILGRAVWKPRYVVLGTGAHLQTQTDLLSRSESSSRKGPKATSSKPTSLVDVTQPAPEGLYISIYKAKGDWEYLAQYHMSTFKSCEIRQLQHRKQSPTLPTLLLDFKPDKAAEKLRKRRSSRTGGLTSKDPWADTLLFRTIPEEKHSIFDWQVAVKAELKPGNLDDSPLSPSSPLFPSFTNPFGRDHRVPSKSTGRPELPSRNTSQSSYPHAPKERPSALISPSPSLRSRRSDLSSQSSSQHPPVGFTHNYTTALPTDLPSPAMSGYDSQFIEGWTSAQGRSSALSSHTRGSNSIASAIAPPTSTSQGPRETILDRAFQMRCIPGSDRVQDKDEEKISSIARFEALMREADARKLEKGPATKKIDQTQWDLDEESEESSVENDDEDDLDLSDQDVMIPTPARRALDYISSRHVPSQRPLSPTPRSPPPFQNTQAISAFHGISTPLPNLGSLRPRTSTTSSPRPVSMALPHRSTSTSTSPSLRNHPLSSNPPNSNNLAVSPAEKEKRRSSASVTRLSFTEFTKRLSSTSSLLLVQTNASSSSGLDGSRRGSSDFDSEELNKGGLRSSVSLRNPSSSMSEKEREREMRDKRIVSGDGDDHDHALPYSEKLLLIVNFNFALQEIKGSEVDVRIKRYPEGSYYDEYVKIGDLEKPNATEFERYIVAEPGTMFEVEITLKKGFNFKQHDEALAVLEFLGDSNSFIGSESATPSTGGVLNSIKSDLKFSIKYVDPSVFGLKNSRLAFRALSGDDSLPKGETDRAGISPKDLDGFKIDICTCLKASGRTEQITYGNIPLEVKKVDENSFGKDGITCAIGQSSLFILADFLERINCVKFPPPLHLYAWEVLMPAERRVALKELQRINKEHTKKAFEAKNGSVMSKSGRGVGENEPKEWRAWNKMRGWERKAAFMSLQDARKEAEREQVQRQFETNAVEINSLVDEDKSAKARKSAVLKRERSPSISSNGMAILIGETGLPALGGNAVPPARASVKPEQEVKEIIDVDARALKKIKTVTPQVATYSLEIEEMRRESMELAKEIEEAERLTQMRKKQNALKKKIEAAKEKASTSKEPFVID